MFTLSQMKIIVSLAESIQTWIDTVSDGDEWQSASGWIGDGLHERMALAALLPVFQSRSDQDYLRHEKMLKNL